MALTLADINDLKQGFRDPVHVGNIPYDVSKHLELKNSNVYFSLRSYKHIQKKHTDVTDFDLLMLPLAIQHGLLISEYKKPNIIMCSYFEPNIGKRYIISVKFAANKTEVWVCSMYRAKLRQTRALLKKGEILKAHSKHSTR